MRRVLLLGALFAIGCRPPVGKQEEHFKDLLLLHFNNLNNEAELAKMDAKMGAKSPTTPPSIGRQFSTYQFWPTGVILQDIECPGCKTKHLVVTYRGEQVLCPTCGSRNKDGKVDRPMLAGGLTTDQLRGTYADRVKPMFELKGEVNKDKIAIVRYVRRHWVLDPLAKPEGVAVKTSTKPEHQAAAGEISKWAGGDPKTSYYSNGFHRLDGTFVGTAAFVYDGTISQIDPVSSAKIAAGTTPDRKTWKTGGSAALEEPLRPWNNPGSLDTPNVRSY